MNGKAQGKRALLGHGVFIDGFKGKNVDDETNRGDCACGKQYEVSAEYHWIDSKDIRHTRDKCA